MRLDPIMPLSQSAVNSWDKWQEGVRGMDKTGKILYSARSFVLFLKLFPWMNIQMASIASSTPCDECGFDIPASSDRCPHCGRPSLFPNVTAAKRPMEQAALEQRYQTALQNVDPACLPILDKFEKSVENQSEAVITRYVSEVYTLAANENALYGNFYQLVGAGVRLPAENFWETIRGVVDEKLFTHYKENIRFAALTMNRRGIGHYGDCHMTLKSDMIAHRATVFEENSIVFMDRRKEFLTAELPAGYRAIWQDRGKLAVAKLASKLSHTMTEADFSSLLMNDGAKPEDDQFVEVHIYGSFSMRTVEEISLSSGSRTVYPEALKEKLDKFGIRLKRH
ncbi:MAG: hypothetical protein NTX45_08885 [Proteobacteria bacterium]|nr:hypothetical protein [Pseudomonadota bacterium]